MSPRGPSKRNRLRRQLRVERLSERRVLAAIAGFVFDDSNLSLQQDGTEQNLADRVVYIDISNDGFLNNGEPLTTTDESGFFLFDDVPDGTYALRVYNGSTSQDQVFPANALDVGENINLEDGVDLVLSGDAPVAFTSETVEFGNFTTGQVQSLNVGDSLVGSQTLPSGAVLLLGGSGTANNAWLVDPRSETTQPIDISGGAPVAWSALAVDGQGNGVAISVDSQSGSLLTVDATNEASGIEVVETGIVVPVDTQTIASSTGTRSVLAWAGSQGLEVSLWSNSTGTFITTTPRVIPDTTQLVAYDDASGILVLRTDDGGLSVHDVDGNFATLATIDQSRGATALDSERNLIVSVSPSNESIEFFGATTGELLDSVPADLENIGAVNEIAYSGADRSLTLLGQAGLKRLAFTDPASQIVVVEDGEDTELTSFGIRLLDSNQAPVESVDLSYTVDEDFTLTVGAPGALIDVVDPDDNDLFIGFVTSPPSNGVVNLDLGGGFRYTPNANYNGTDSFTLVAHDGRDRSEEITVNVTVNPVADPPTGIIADIGPIPENAIAGFGLGPIIIQDGDLNDNHNIIVAGGPFDIIGGQLIFLGGELDFEQQPEVELSIMVNDDLATTTLFETINIFVTDVNEPITGIGPLEARVEENVPGAHVASLFVEDQDFGSAPVFTVDDDRFVVEGDQLRLADGVALDHEATPTVTLMVTATDGDSFTQEITISVLDIAEQPTSITLVNNGVIELRPGATVGAVSVDGNAPGDNYNVDVSDDRFELVDGILKLRDEEWVERSEQEQIQLTITVQDTRQEFAPISRQYVLNVLENATPHHNEDNPYDANQDGQVSAADALTIINFINTYGPGPATEIEPGISADVNNDNLISPLDIILVINELNAIQNGSGGTVGGEGEPEGELIQSPILPPAVTTNDEDEVPTDPTIDNGASGDSLAGDDSSSGQTSDSGSESESGDESSPSDESVNDAVDAAISSFSDES